MRQALARPAAQAVLPAGFRAEDYRVPAGRVSRLLGDGDEIDLGDRRLTVLHTPGHCPGHCGFWDPDAGVLFSADTAYQGPMYTCFPGGDPVAFAESAHRLAGLPGVTLICPGHNRPIRDAAWLGALAHGATAALEGRHPHTARRGFVTGRVFQFPTFSLWLPLHPS